MRYGSDACLICVIGDHRAGQVAVSRVWRAVPFVAARGTLASPAASHRSEAEEDCAMWPGTGSLFDAGDDH
jgi:hypothetical protein